MRADVPAQEIVDCACRSCAMEGRRTLMPFWSMKQTIKDKDMMLKTKMSWRLGRTGRGFRRLVCFFPFLFFFGSELGENEQCWKNDPPKVKVSTHY